MFKKASMKLIARDTTASTGSNQVMHPLISAEKAVLLSMQKLAGDIDKATEALKTWGSSENDDLGGVLTASTSLLHHFSLALSQYISTGHTMQRQLESMATRGDSLDNLKQRRNSAHRKADDTAVQLKKMSPENKYYAMHTEALKRLRTDVRKMDSEIKLEDAAFGDFKRTTTKVWMTLKFGGLHDCCQKGTIAGRYGKLVTTEISEETTQHGMPRSPYSSTKVDNLLAEADRQINAVGQSAANRQSFQTSQESSNASFTDSPTSPQRSYQEPSPSMYGPPQPPPKLQSHHNSANYDQPIESSRISNDRFSERADFLQDPSLSKRPAVDSSIPESMAGPPHFHGPPPNQFPTPQVQHRRPDSSDSGGYSLSQPSLGGRSNPSISEGTSHPRDPATTRPPGSSELGGYALQDPRSLSAPQRMNDPSFYEGTSHWNNAHPAPSSATMRPPESGRYPSQDPPSSSRRYLNGDPSFSAATSHWQIPPFDQYPTPPRPPTIPESGRYPAQDPPSLGGRSDSSFPGGPSHWQNSTSDRFTTPPRPPGSSDSGRPLQDTAPVNGRYRNDPSFSNGPSHWQNPPPPPPVSSGSGTYPVSVQDSHSLGQPHRDNNPSPSVGSSHSQNSPPEQFPVPPRPPLSESRRQPSHEPPHLGGRNLTGYSSNEKSHLQGPITMTPHGTMQSGGYALQDPRSSSRRHPDDPSFSESTAGPSEWATSRFNGHGGSESSVISEGMTRPRQGSYSQQQQHMDAWGGTTDPDDSPPAYRDFVHHESLPDAAGHFSAPAPPGPRGGPGRW